MKEPSKNMSQVTLASVPVGHVARILEINDTNSPEGVAPTNAVDKKHSFGGVHAEPMNLEFRLLELGLEVGETVEVLVVGPFGNPIALGFDGHIVALRKREAERIMVEVNG